MRARLGAAVAVALGMATMVGCGSDTAPGAGSTSGAGESTASAPSGSGSPTSSSEEPSSSVDRTFHGTVVGDGLTCIGFTTTEGKRYALTGHVVPAKLKKVAHSGFQQRNRAPQEAKVTVVGHVAPHAMSTCGYTVLVASKVTITSVGPATLPSA